MNQELPNRQWEISKYEDGNECRPDDLGARALWHSKERKSDTLFKKSRGDDR